MAHVVISRRSFASARRGHPWIYAGSVAHISSPGDGVVEIFDEERAHLGWGVLERASPITVRVWSLEKKEKLDAALFRRRLASALAVRRRLFRDGKTTAYRLLNGEGDRTPGFVLDRYGSAAVLRTDGEAARGLARELLADIEAPLRAIGIDALALRSSTRGGGRPELEPWFGTLPSRVVVQEHGVPLLVDLEKGQKTGAFLDQRENRRRIGALVARHVAERERPAHVLNLFSYTGGFSLHAALAGGVVTSVDVAAAAHATAQETFRLAEVDPRAHTFATADCFAWLERARTEGKKWDVVISDPPSFAPSEKAKPKGLAAYRALHRACALVLADGGSLVAASCSSHVNAEDFAGTLDDAVLGRSDLRLTETFGQPPDHPTLAAFPEGRYLKLAVLA